MLLVELTKQKKPVNIHISCKEATALVDKRIKLGVIFDTVNRQHAAYLQILNLPNIIVSLDI